jgi:spermidine synthase
MNAPLVLVLLFAGSGMAALIYEVVWQQLLQLVIGSSTLSLGVLLATFMGGMCIGSLAAPRVFSSRHHPLRIYAGLEAAIGLMGLLLLFGMPLAQRLYLLGGGWGTSGLAMRAGLAAICLLPPTFAMGATLPVVARWTDRDARGRAWLALFYAGNLGGAVAGCLLAGFVLLPLFDMAVATYVAAAINVLVATVAWLAASSSHAAGTTRDNEPPGIIDLRTSGGSVPFNGSWRIYLIVGLSGFGALAAEVIWTRLLALVFGATVYTFSIVLSVFLIGLGIGSSLGAALVRRAARAVTALGWCQLATVAAVVWSAYAIERVLPYWTLADAGTQDIWSVFRFDFVRSLVALLPAPVLWGASFSLALAAAAEAHPDQGRVAGRVYAANTLGAIAGALLASVALVPLAGSRHAQQVIQVAAAVSGLVALASPLGVRRASVAGIAVAGLTVAFAALVPPLPGILVGYGRHAAAWTGFASNIIYVGEGMHASVAVSRNDDGVLNYHNAGKVQASSQPADMRLQRMLGHLTTLMPPRPRKVLVIGCGAGVTAGAVSVNPAVEQVTIVDIEPLVPQVAREYFGSVNHDVLKNPKVRVIADDARHFLQTTTETFDAITSDPLDPWVKGAATLYTREFFDTARRHLNPGGVMTLYVQLFESSPQAVKSEVATFFSAFPEGLVFANTFEGHAIDMVLVGPLEPPKIWIDEIEDLLRSPGFAPVDGSLMQAGLYGATDLFGNYAGRARDLAGWLADAEVTHDLDLRLQYLAGLGLNQHAGDEIYREMLAYRSFPDDLFVGSESTLDELKAVMAGTRE